MTYRKTAIRIDVDAARLAAVALDTKTLTDTVNEALRRAAQMESIRELGRLFAEAGIDPAIYDEFDAEEFAEAEGRTYEGAHWRS